MSSLQLIEAVRRGDIVVAEELIASGVDVNGHDEQGWTALNFAAGKGDTAFIQLLVENGADIFRVGRDQRTPYQIALAAGRVEAVKLLQTMEPASEGNEPRRSERKYCRAYMLSELRAFSGWEQGVQAHASDIHKTGDGLDDDSPLYLHDDYRVTKSIESMKHLVFSDVGSEWKEFCTTTLHFKAPSDLDLIA
jgi:ankyrin repeat protein